MKVAVIGAGCSGLVSIKCCLDEGLEPVCFERSDDIGGLWRYTPEVEDGRASIYESVVTNTSKEMMCYSDFPFPDEHSNFMHNTKVVEYYRQYAKRFSLMKYIEFKTLVCSVKKHPNFPRTGQWEVTTEKDGKKQTSTFDAVMVCNGHLSDPHYPLDDFPGINTFKGKYFHSREYKTSKGFEGKRVLIVGIGNSGADIAVELSRTASQYKEPLFNDELPSRIICGYVVVKPNVTEFSDMSVKFDDGSIEENIDVVVFATGYRYSFPFLDESIIKIEDKIHLYRNIFPINLKKATLSVIGLIQPLGPVMPIAEMQARWITRVFKGLCKLPSEDIMKKDVERKKKILIERYGKDYSLEMDWIEYLDELAIDIGCKPNIFGLFVTDPALALKIVFGPCTPAQYRLRGPGQWPMARKQIMTTIDRILKPTKTRMVHTKEQKSLSIVYVTGALSIFLLISAVVMNRK